MAAVSGRELAKALNVSEGAIRKLKAGRLAGAMTADGRFDLDRARALYADVNPAMRRDRPGAPAPAAPASTSGNADADPGGTLPAGGGSQETKARAILVTEKALRERIKRRKDEGSTIEKEKTLVLVQSLARTFRDSLLSFTDQTYAQLAAELEYPATPVPGAIIVAENHPEDQITFVQANDYTGEAGRNDRTLNDPKHLLGQVKTGLVISANPISGQPTLTVDIGLVAGTWSGPAQIQFPEI